MRSDNDLLRIVEQRIHDNYAIARAIDEVTAVIAFAIFCLALWACLHFVEIPL